jgi:ParB-like chromosome segregation protein Spo0J
MNPSTTAPDQSTNSGDGTASRLSGQDLRVEQRAVETLIPYARNARTHSDKQVAEIAGSIKAFGWTNPILVDGEKGVIAGHGRLLAAKKLKLGTVPVIELSGLSEAEKRAYILADNKLALNAGWSDELLAAEVADLDALGFDLSLAGFGESEVGKLITCSRRVVPCPSPTGRRTRRRCRSAGEAISGLWESTGCSVAMR